MASGEGDQAIILEINQRLKVAYQKEEDYWKQRSRTLWLALGDKNSGFFHAMTRGRTAINKLAILEDKNGVAVYEESKILEVISSYFQDLFITHSSPCSETVNQALQPCISQAMNDALIADPSALEIKTALFSINPDKAPGPDGFSAGFFQTNWSVMGPQIVKEVQEIFDERTIPSSINSTFVRLIPKVTSPKTVAEYRPIALCNVYYKIISKILTRRLQPILPTIISEIQTAFVPERAISDNVLITHETLHYLKSSGATKYCSMAVKTDMSKAYDRLEWSFNLAVMERMGFHQKWINWIFQCISTVSYAFLINGAAAGRVDPLRGIRQGDPLLPFIFFLCTEVLSGLFKKAQENGSMPGISVSRQSPKINHLLFADDTIFFSKTNPRSCETLCSILKKYEEASGQQINLQKSSITFSRKTPQDIRERVKVPLGINKEGGQGKYLGLPESFGRRKKDLFTLIVDRVRQRAIKYSSRFLSMAGKMTMIKSVLSAIPTYAMSCFKLPAGLYKRIQSAITRFWWDTTLGKKKMSWISWTRLTRSKKQGGLGFREIQSFNDSLLAKISWRILQNPSCLLSKVLLGKYCKDKTFLNVPITTSTSHETLNKAIVEAREWQQAQKEPENPPTRPPQSNQVAIQPNTISCFTDGAWSEENGIGGFSWVFADDSGTIIDSGQGAERFVSSPFMAEALAIRSAFHHAIEKGFSKIHLKSDA
ncbi:unnamed protein product [Microthlaspi erraticum]|uniref:Reverse transcriptase domain-containing protein n=1 Tax=Microthlaspi erraticum TaxID=1685480 RepID=A0A6D2I5C7_9BRAS|nr:unnamed protein product [Microthlaspi erraticum]